jgi:hypothetical protein
VCDSRTEYCESILPGIRFPDGGTPPTSYTCQPLPASCIGSATCACVAPGATLPTTCSDANGRVTVQRAGI